MSDYAYHGKRIDAKVIRMGFSDIEDSRRTAKIGQAALCARAGVHPTTYSRLKNRAGRLGASERTLTKLKRALDALIREGSDGRA